MQKQRHSLAFRRATPARRGASRALGAVTAAFAMVWGGAALAQTGPSAPPQDAPASESLDAVEPLGPVDRPAPLDRDAALDALFAELAEAETGAHQRIEQEIRRIWMRSGSDTADLLLQRGREALEKRDFVRAIHHLTALTEIAPGFAEGWNLRATAFFAKGDLTPSLVDIERALELEPRHWGALSGLGLILEQLGREADALTAYRAARDLNPHLPNIEDAVGRLAPKVDGRDI